MWFLIFSILFSIGDPPLRTESSDSAYMLLKVNALRSKGCKCGYKNLPPAQPLKWNATLEKSALSHAKDMAKYNFFAHYSKDGKDIGQRIKEHGYRWQVVGENIAEGQHTFDQALQDWIKSESHCKMLMDPRVTEMGISKYKKYWVHHFGKPQSGNSRYRR